MKQQFMYLDAITSPNGRSSRRLKVLLLADDQHISNPVRDYINAFVIYSDNEITVTNPIHARTPNYFQFCSFDVVIIHYSIYVLGDYFLSEEYREVIKKFPGLKVQIIQDEHRLINQMKEQMADFGVSIIISSLAPRNAQEVYGSDNLPGITVVSCMPGYIPDELHKIKAPDIAERPLDVVYRGRTLTPTLGIHSYDKLRIGEEFAAVAKSNGLTFDISSDEESRLYGDDWLRFLSSGRATLGVEGGASIFDFDGQVSRLVSEFRELNPSAGFHEIWKSTVSQYEGNVVHKTITPRILEAVATKTALVLFPGEYSGVLSPGQHYIELKRDFSNIDMVLEQLRDTSGLQRLVDRNFDEILGLERLTFRYFIIKLDQLILDRVLRFNRAVAFFERAIFFVQMLSKAQLKPTRVKLLKILKGKFQFNRS